MINPHFTDELSQTIKNESTLSELSKNKLLRSLAKMKKTQVNILITGATGCGKSSTINALFDANKAKVGVGVRPETMEIAKYQLDNIVLFDSPGLGDGKEADLRHAKKITEKLCETDGNGNLLIDLVLVILDGSSRDLGTSFELINRVIIPALNGNSDRLLVAINQADVAMKGRYWDNNNNEPMPPLIRFLEEKVASTQERIMEATGMRVTPIYYAAGYQDGDVIQQPYNLSKLMLYILQHVKEEKRAVFVQDINTNPKVWQHDDQLDNYREKVRETMWESITKTISNCADIGEKIGSVLGNPGAIVGKALGAFAGAVGGFFGHTISRFFF